MKALDKHLINKYGKTELNKLGRCYLAVNGTETQHDTLVGDHDVVVRLITAIYGTDEHRNILTTDDEELVRAMASACFDDTDNPRYSDDENEVIDDVKIDIEELVFYLDGLPNLDGVSVHHEHNWAIVSA